MAGNIQLVRRFFDEVCNARRLDVADQLFSSDHSYRDPGSPWAAKGPAGMKDVIGVYHRGVNDARWDVHAMLESGDTVITAGPAVAHIPATCSVLRRPARR